MTLAVTSRRDGLAAVADPRLTALEVAVLYYVADFETEAGELPPTGEVAGRFNLTSPEVDAVLERLEVEGYLGSADAEIVKMLEAIASLDPGLPITPVGRHVLMVLALGYHDAPLSSPDLARATGWSRSPVDKALEQLVAAAFVERSTVSVGRTPATYRVLAGPLDS